MTWAFHPRIVSDNRLPTFVHLGPHGITFLRRAEIEGHHFLMSVHLEVNPMAIQRGKCQGQYFNEVETEDSVVTQKQLMAALHHALVIWEAFHHLRI